MYWDADANQVKRCTWFYKREGDKRYVPYDEDFAVRLEVNINIYTTTNIIWEGVNRNRPVVHLAIRSNILSFPHLPHLLMDYDQTSHKK